MEKQNKICLIVIIVCIVLVGTFCGVLIYRNSKREVITDAMKFKEEYEAYNEIELDNGSILPTVVIDEDNPFVYKTGKEILDIMNNEEAIIYFGFASCPWCRNIIEVLNDVAKDNNIATIYYVDIKDIRDEYKFAGSIMPEQTKKGTDAYYEILDFFGDKLSKYYVEDPNENKYDTGVTRLYAPTVIAVQDGEIMDMHVATIEEQTNPFEVLDEDGQKELYNIYEKLIKSI